MSRGCPNRTGSSMWNFADGSSHARMLARATPHGLPAIWEKPKCSMKRLPNLPSLMRTRPTAITPCSSEPSVRDESECAPRAPMAEIFPFRAIRYDSGRVPLDCALTQPYDKITPEMQARYYAASPYNLIAVEKGKTLPTDSSADNVYTRAARSLDDWLAQGILVRDPAPAIYVYFQNYALPGTTRARERRGFIALGRLADYDEGIVFRHERTLTAPKADRLELLRHIRTQTGQLFLLYDDPSRRVDTLLDEVSKAP